MELLYGICIPYFSKLRFVSRTMKCPMHVVNLRVQLCTAEEICHCVQASFVTFKVDLACLG